MENIPQLLDWSQYNCQRNRPKRKKIHVCTLDDPFIRKLALQAGGYGGVIYTEKWSDLPGIQNPRLVTIISTINLFIL